MMWSNITMISEFFLEIVRPSELAKGREIACFTMKKRYELLNNSLPAALEAYTEAQETASIAKAYYSNFNDDILEEFQCILRHNRAKREEWTANVVRAQAERFAELGDLVRGKLEEKFLKPLVEEQNALEVLQRIQKKIAELEAKVN